MKSCDVQQMAVEGIGDILVEERNRAGAVVEEPAEQDTVEVVERLLVAVEEEGEELVLWVEVHLILA